MRPATPLRPTLLALLLALLAGSPAAAQGTPEGGDTATRLTARLAADLALTGAEARSLEMPIRAHLSQGGREQGLRQLLSAALATGCRGPCPAQAVRSMNRARSAGLSLTDARRMVTRELAAATAAGGPSGAPPTHAELAEALRTRVDAHLGEWVTETGAAPVPAPVPPRSEPAAGWPPERPRLP